MQQYTRLLTIAGSDSGGGAGIQADLKTFSALGCYGMSAITALTAQNTRGVDDVMPVPAAFLAAQIDAVMDDIGTDAVKIGMLNDADIIKVVADKIRHYNIANVVLDPVIVSKSGYQLLANSAIDALKKDLIPLSLLITPNLPEAATLTGMRITDKASMKNAMPGLCELGARHVLLKGGHLEGEQMLDICYDCDGRSSLQLESFKMNTNNTHGTGCTLSSAVAAYLAKGFSVPEAVSHARDYLVHALDMGSNYTLGKGYGPVHHFYNWWK